MSHAAEKSLAVVDFHDMVLYGQPIFSAKGTPLYVEALTRFRSNKTGFTMPPQEFFEHLPYGEAMKLFKRQLDAIIAHLSKNPDTRLGINIAPALLLPQHGSLELLSDCFERGLLRPGQLIIEITEQPQRDRDKKAIIESARHLKSLGIQFAIDDFGTRGSNFDLVHEWTGTADYIKIDGFLFRRALCDGRCRTTLKFLINFFHENDMRVILEHVEHESEFSIVEALGGDGAQGYGVGHPEDLGLPVIQSDVILSHSNSSPFQ